MIRTSAKGSTSIMWRQSGALGPMRTAPAGSARRLCTRSSTTQTARTMSRTVARYAGGLYGVIGFAAASAYAASVYAYEYERTRDQGLTIDERLRAGLIKLAQCPMQVGSMLLCWPVLPSVVKQMALDREAQMSRMRATTRSQIDTARDQGMRDAEIRARARRQQKALKRKGQGRTQEAQRHTQEKQRGQEEQPRAREAQSALSLDAIKSAPKVVSIAAPLAPATRTDPLACRDSVLCTCSPCVH
ncbi:hypothetical protein psal_cds_709 [Pandoravirus salinus]|uniref:Uncharacterized protein n=1 Tax=Pandoravirus salinus TaxID=1349410 RepID=A0A291ATV9_9VIRU|nr:hypothetical protein psal_cds_709 [Pandoravirus salinus]ATE82218.1 hypothetical protein psal_cds_709 [Pandoravirus salinus]